MARERAPWYKSAGRNQIWNFFLGKGMSPDNNRPMNPMVPLDLGDFFSCKSYGHLMDWSIPVDLNNDVVDLGNDVVDLGNDVVDLGNNVVNLGNNVVNLGNNVVDLGYNVVDLGYNVIDKTKRVRQGRSRQIPIRIF
jgi:hypothetical protein